MKIEEQLAIAIVRCKMSFETFCALTPSEWEACVKELQKVEETENRESWEQSRLVAFSAIRAHLKEGVTLTEFLPLPWDPKKQKIITTKEDVERMLEQFKE